MIRVVIVDDHALVRQGIRSLLALAPDVEVVGEACNGDEAATLIPTLLPDVVLLDVRMPGKDGLQVLDDLSERLPPTILLTTFDDDAVVLEAIRRGAKGFLLKDVSLERLTHSVRKVASGESLFLSSVSERVIAALRAAPPTFDSLEQPDAPTAREVEVLRLMAGGYSNREIAYALRASEGTIKNHVSSLLSKLGVRDRTRAVLKAIDLRWI